MLCVGRGGRSRLLCRSPLLLAAMQTSSFALAPVARRELRDVQFGRVAGENRGALAMDPAKTMKDPYFWLRDDARESEEVLEHLRLENEFSLGVARRIVR